jgi:HK97 family phage major capsid protein
MENGMRKAFIGPDADARYERCGKWILASVYGRKNARDWCDRKGVSITKAQGDGIGASGGFLVPTELETAILDLRDSYGAFRRRALKWPMSSDSSVFPRRVGSAQAFFFGEGSTASGTSLQADAVNLTAKKLGALVTLSSELNEDAIVDVVDYIANELAWAFAVKEDDCAFNGDGTSAYGGIRGIGPTALDGNHGIAKVTAAVGHNTFLTLDTTDLAKLMGAVRASAMPRSAWYVSAQGFSQTFSRIAAATGSTLAETTEDGITTWAYNGFPVILTPKLPQSSGSLSGSMMLAFGDMYGTAVIGQRRGLTIAQSQDRYLENDQIAILATERFDAVIHDMGDNTTAGSMAALTAP